MTPIRESFSVGDRFRITWTVLSDEVGQPVGLHCEWEPWIPATLTSGERADYFRARETVLKKLADCSTLGTQ
jgi:hypothetical protein